MSRESHWRLHGEKMTATLKFVCDSTTVSLQLGSSTTGLQLLAGWQPKIGQPGNATTPLSELLPVLAIGSSQDNLATTLQGLHDMQIWAQRYLQSVDDRRPVWLHAQLSGETMERRALVYGIEATFRSGWFDAESATYMQELVLVVERGPWEALVSIYGVDETLQTGAVVSFDYTAAPGIDVGGDLPARIEELRVYTKPDSATDEYDRFWIGLRSAARHGTLANFRPLWECETSATLENGASLTTDSTASPGGTGNTKVQVSGSATATWLRRCTRSMSGLTSSYTDNYGRFLVLLRAKVASGTWNVQMRYTHQSAVVLATGPVVEVSNTSWDIHEMGVVELPLRDVQAVQVGTAPFTIDRYLSYEIWAERTSGTGALDLDCTINLPVDEGFCIAKGASLDFSLTGYCARLTVGMAPQERLGALGIIPVTTIAETVSGVPMLSAQEFYLPTGDGRIYIVFAGTYASDLADGISAYVSWYNRWLSLRGSEV